MPNSGPPGQEVELLGADVDNRTDRQGSQRLNHQSGWTHVVCARPESQITPIGKGRQQRDPTPNGNSIVGSGFCCSGSDRKTHDVSAPKSMHAGGQLQVVVNA